MTRHPVSRRFRFGSGLVLALRLVPLMVAWLLAAAPARADMTLNLGKLSSNGLEVRSLSCKLKSGGLLGSMLIVAELSKQKKAFDRCGPKGAAFRAEFTWQQGKPTQAQVLASSEPKGDACLVAALKQTQAAVVGTCTAVLLTGDTAKAEAAAEGLPKAE